MYQNQETTKHMSLLVETVLKHKTLKDSGSAQKAATFSPVVSSSHCLGGINELICAVSSLHKHAMLIFSVSFLASTGDMTVPSECSY